MEFSSLYKMIFYYNDQLCTSSYPKAVRGLYLLADEVRMICYGDAGSSVENTGKTTKKTSTFDVR